MKRSAKRLTSRTIASLCAIARKVRIDVLRMIYAAHSGNPGSALSPCEIMVWLYHHEMTIKPKTPRWKRRDRFILSKGQASPAYYSIFSRLGWIRRRELTTYRKINSRLQTHPEYDALQGIDYTSGSLGQGLSAAVGMALADRYLKRYEPRYFVLLGDGEIQEGQIWEAALSARKFGLENVVALIDRNGFQGDDRIDHVMPLEQLEDTWASFGWEVRVVDGHDYLSLYGGLRDLEHSRKPKVMICNTVKGKDVSFMEGRAEWHTAALLSDRLFRKALCELSGGSI
ncbi:MAG: transketolase [Candidatus Omnitrophota bacterium]